MSAALDYAPQYGALPRRKALGPAGPSYPSGVTGNDQIYTREPSHARSSSSSAPPPGPGQQSYPTQHHYTPPRHDNPGTRRTLSNATSSTTSSGTNQGMSRVSTQASLKSSLNRTVSSRSQQQAAQNSYVALLRRQKATVWCDHAQHEDPRVLAQQRQAKARANMHLVGGVGGGQLRHVAQSSGGVRQKIRHGNAVKASAYQAGSNLSGAGVPMRLSASEVDDGNDSDDGLRNNRAHHPPGKANESTRSSMSSTTGGKPAAPAAPNPARLSASSTPSSSRNSYSPAARDSTDGTPVPAEAGRNNDYFGEAERGFGESAPLPVRVASVRAPAATAEELRRRGSVDERTTTMTGVRLFVANPDLSD